MDSNDISNLSTNTDASIVVDTSLLNESINVPVVGVTDANGREGDVLVNASQNPSASDSGADRIPLEMNDELGTLEVSMLLPACDPKYIVREGIQGSLKGQPTHRYYNLRNGIGNELT